MYKNVRNVLLNPAFPTGFFLDPSEQEQLVAGLVYYGILKLSNKRDLPLKKGGFTDIYINIREDRLHWEAIGFLADFYAMALKRLKVARIADVPLAVSNLSGSIQERLRIPAITIREQEKQGRATKGLIIGEVRPGEIIGAYDDVITSGGSAETPYWAVTAMGALPYLIVMVDRMQGWKQNFANKGINMSVWAGTDLHTVRRHVIDTFGLMQRCDPLTEAQNPFILALDGKPWEVILPIMDVLRPTGCIFKINDLAHDQSRSHIARDVGVYGRTMIDFKGHDIPETVYNTCMQYRNNPPWAVTIHASGGQDMVAAAVRAFMGTQTKVLAVTVPTSITDDGCDTIYHRERLDQVKTLAAIGNDGGCDGFVCSGNEVGELSEIYPHREFVVPGTRSPGAEKHDQKNVITHAEGIDRGATHLVAGRQFFNAKDPVAEFNRVMTDELHITL